MATRDAVDVEQLACECEGKPLRGGEY